MKQVVFYQAIFYTFLFVVFFLLTINAINHFGWGFLAIFNALIATADFVRACRLFGLYFQMRKKD